MEFQLKLLEKFRGIIHFRFMQLWIQNQFCLGTNVGQRNLNDNCSILGHLNRNEMKMMYLCSDLVISSPLRPEGFGRTISEALSMKKIILAYNFDAYPIIYMLWYFNSKHTLSHR